MDTPRTRQPTAAALESASESLQPDGARSKAHPSIHTEQAPRPQRKRQTQAEKHAGKLSLPVTHILLITDHLNALTDRAKGMAANTAAVSRLPGYFSCLIY